MLRGKIIKGIAGFYYVHAAEAGIYECRAKGLFRKEKIKPLVGDDAEFAVLDEGERIGNIGGILPRKNVLVRPAVANIDQALVIFAVADPAPNLNLLDRFLLSMAAPKIPSIVCFNKRELVGSEEIARLSDIYRDCGCEVLFVSAASGEGMEAVRRVTKGKTTAVAGPSGVGKSSIINILQPNACMETGSVSKKTDRGRHTTRHSELIAIDADSYIMDTPGFSSLFPADMEKEDLKDYFAEFARYAGKCRFQGCNHIGEPDCAVKEALGEGRISRSRYDSYVLLYEELMERKRY